MNSTINIERDIYSGKRIFKKKYPWFVFLETFVLFAISLYIILNYPKGTFSIAFNKLNTPFLDFLFKYITYFGDSIIYFIPLTFLWFIKKKKVILLIFLFIIQTFFSTIFKYYIAKGAPRPAGYFSDDFFSTLHKVDGVKIYYHHSFPSGHTMTAFSIAFFFIFVHRIPKLYQFTLVNLAVFVGLSRIYLLEHFLIDVLFGAMLGIFSAYLVSILPLRKLIRIKKTTIA
jgi:membrane-associated phospholipid phosphatase